MKKSALDLLTDRFYPETQIKVEELVADSVLLRKLTEAAYKKLEDSIQYYANMAERIQYTILLVNDWSNKRYTDIELKNIIVGIVILIYFVSPIDFIPDLIPYIGRKDDRFLFKLFGKEIDKEIEKYKVWRETSK